MYYCHFIIILFVAARDRLSDLTSREGDWFMDELCTMGGNVFQMSTTLEMCLSVSITYIIHIQHVVLFVSFYCSILVMIFSLIHS